MNTAIYPITLRRLSPCPRLGLTLLELVVVIAILVILAGFIIPLAGDQIVKSKTVATNANMVLIRNAIMGVQNAPGFYNDTGRLPITVAELFIQPANVPAFNRDTAQGWNGPYLINQGGQYTVNASTNFFQYVGGTNGYPGSGYGQPGDPAILDGWGHPIILQIPNQTSSAGTYSLALAADLQFARLVSAGPNGIIDTPPNAIDTTDSLNNPYPLPALRGDDLVLFINHSDSDP